MSNSYQFEIYIVTENIQILQIFIYILLFEIGRNNSRI